MDVWSRDHRRPIEQEEKDRVAAGWYTSPDSEPRVRSAPAGDVPPTSRRVAHSRNVPRFRSLRERREGGREVQRWLNAWRLWEISVFPLTVLIMDVPFFTLSVTSFSLCRSCHVVIIHFAREIGAIIVSVILDVAIRLCSTETLEVEFTKRWG